MVIESDVHSFVEKMVNLGLFSSENTIKSVSVSFSIPNLHDQELFTKFLIQEWKMGVKIEKSGENGMWVSKKSLCNGIKSVMDEDREIGNFVRKNHENLRQK